jgi:hypothetical protein
MGWGNAAMATRRKCGEVSVKRNEPVGSTSTVQVFNAALSRRAKSRCQLVQPCRAGQAVR